MSRGWQDPAWVEMMLEECSTWAVVGLSGDPSRTAYSIASLLQDRGKRIIPVHPLAAQEGGLQRALDHDIVDIAAVAGNETRILHALDGRADITDTHGSASLLHNRGGVERGGDDVLVTGAATEIP